MNVLVVDDSRIMRNIVKNSFTKLGYSDTQYFEAEDGAKALAVLGQQKIDLVLIDWNMPSLSGLEFLKTVRGMGEYITLPVIMITSEAARYNVIEALKEGATSYLIKPLDEKAFTKAVTAIFSK